MSAPGDTPLDGVPDRWGMIHGRFQPFHNGHFAYLRAAADRSERLLIGITNPDSERTAAEVEDPNRHRPEANPFTYTERLLMIEAAVDDAGLEIPVKVIPFPVNRPELWPDYVPPNTVHYLRVFSAWGRLKQNRLRLAGYEVVVLDAGTAKDISGEDVRTVWRANGSLEALVPPSVAHMLRGVSCSREERLHSPV